MKRRSYGASKLALQCQPLDLADKFPKAVVLLMALLNLRLPGLITPHLRDVKSQSITDVGLPRATSTPPNTQLSLRYQSASGRVTKEWILTATGTTVPRQKIHT